MNLGHDWKRETLWCTIGMVVGAALSPVLGAAATWAWNLVGVHESPEATSSPAVVHIAPPVCNTKGSRGPGQTVEIWIRRNKQECWQPELSPIAAGTHAELEVGYGNYSSVRVNNAVLQIKLPVGLKLVPSTSYLKNGNNPDGLKISNRIAGIGVNIGNYGKRSNAYVKFRVQVAENFACGKTRAPVKLTSYSSSSAETRATSMDMNVWRICQP